MYKKTVKYEDFDGNQREDTLYFNLSKTEIAEVEMSYPGGYAKKLNDIGKSGDNKEIFSTFKSIVEKAYGEKSEDGRHFRKSPEIVSDFVNSAAFDQFMFDLLSDGGRTAAEFVNGIMPNTGMTDDDLYEKTRKLIDEKSNPDNVIDLPSESTR